jgi:hypothetical protein
MFRCVCVQHPGRPRPQHIEEKQGWPMHIEEELNRPKPVLMPGLNRPADIDESPWPKPVLMTGLNRPADIDESPLGRCCKAVPRNSAAQEPTVQHRSWPLHRLRKLIEELI